MFFGHIGVGLAAKRADPKTSIGYLLTAAVALDVLVGVILLFFIGRAETDAPMWWSHGLFMSLVYSAATFALVFLASRSVKTGVIISLLVFSHWVLDFISHPMGMGRVLPPDMPLFFDASKKVGLGLYNSMIAAYVTEFALLVGGAALYLTGTRARDRTGKWAFWVMIAFLASMPAIILLAPGFPALPCLVEALLLPLGIWADRHREARTTGLQVFGGT